MATLAALGTAAFAAAAAHDTKHVDSSGRTPTAPANQTEEDDSTFAPAVAPQSTVAPPVATSGGS